MVRRTTIGVIVASPQDVLSERQVVQDTITSINSDRLLGDEVRLDPWILATDSHPGIGEDAQAVVNSQEPTDYQIFIGLWGERLGSTTTRGLSGSEEEFRRALQRFRQHPTSVAVLLYFGNRLVRFQDLDCYQGMLLRRFQLLAGQLGVLWRAYTDTDELRKRLHGDIVHAARNLMSAGSAPILADLPERTPHVYALPAWRASRDVFPQGASYIEVPLEDKQYSSYSLSGIFSSPSEYFRFGFKALLSTVDVPFADTTVKAPSREFLIHIGKNKSSDSLFVTRYRNGVRMESDRSLFDYRPTQRLAIRVECRRDSKLELFVNDELVDGHFLGERLRRRLLIVAWGDQDPFETHFSDMSLGLR